MHVILTACTQRKRFVPHSLLSARDLASGALRDVSREWRARLSRAEPVATANELYCGRSFVEAKKAAQIVRGDLYIASAGLGLLRGDDNAPAYNLTVSKGSPDCILDKLIGDQKAADWWAEIATARAPFEAIERTVGLIILALPSAYLKMIAPTLGQFRQTVLERIRIIGAGREASELPTNLSSQFLPYDERLDGPQSPIRGTKSDFASRAVRHFVEAVLEKAPIASVETHAKIVHETLAPWERPQAKSGTRASDAELKSLIRDHWNRMEGKSTKILRVLRDELNVACEQKRFARLATEVREERAL